MKKFGILIGIIALCLTGCSKDKVADVINGPGGGSGNAGAPFTYHFKILEGENAGFEMSGEIPNSECISVYYSENGNAKKGISFLLNDENKITMAGTLRTDSSGNFIRHVENDPWTLAMVPINKSFFLVSASINVTNVNYIGMPQTGFTSFKLEFEGQFHQNIDENDLYKISGTIVSNHPEM